jgi:hypothetical protein
MRVSGRVVAHELSLCLFTGGGGGGGPCGGGWFSCACRL